MSVRNQPQYSVLSHFAYLYNSKSLSKVYQSVKIVASPSDTVFEKALKLIVNIEGFMSRHYSQMEGTAIISRFGDLPAIRGENWLVVPTHLCKDEAIEPGLVVDGECVLLRVIKGGTHTYTEDNVVHFNEWHISNKNLVTYININIISVIH